MYSMYVWGQELKQKVLTVLGTAQVNFAFKEECTNSYAEGCK